MKLMTLLAPVILTSGVTGTALVKPASHPLWVSCAIRLVCLSQAYSLSWENCW